MDKKKNESALEAATKYVQQQLATMKKFGTAPTLTPKEEEALIRKIAAAAQ